MKQERKARRKSKVIIGREQQTLHGSETQHNHIPKLNTITEVIYFHAKNWLPLCLFRNNQHQDLGSKLEGMINKQICQSTLHSKRWIQSHYLDARCNDVQIN